MNYWKEFTKGIIRQNPLFVIVLGCCPALAVTTSIKNALAMGAAVIAVLVCSNIIIASVRKVIPDAIRIPCFIVVIASFVTMVELLMKAYLPPAINAALGIFIPLIVVNCIILGRAEAFAGKNNVFASALDGLGMGFGYSLAILLMGTVRELTGVGTIWGYKVIPAYQPASIMIMPPGAFIVLGLLLGFFNYLGQRKSV